LFREVDLELELEGVFLDDRAADGDFLDVAMVFSVETDEGEDRRGGQSSCALSSVCRIASEGVGDFQVTRSGRAVLCHSSTEMDCFRRADDTPDDLSRRRQT
jgi:hypothetical protein